MNTRTCKLFGSAFEKYEILIFEHEEATGSYKQSEIHLVPSIYTSISLTAHLDCLQVGEAVPLNPSYSKENMARLSILYFTRKYKTDVLY
jgi:hypothetical protein